MSGARDDAAAYLRLSGISKSFANIGVVRNVSLGVRRGQVLTILGPSGCGKTTTLKIIAGFVAPDTGSIAIDEPLRSRRQGTGTTASIWT